LSNAYMPPSQTDDWATPIELWNKLDQMHDWVAQCSGCGAFSVKLVDDSLVAGLE